jgi:hypothetical protein
MALWMLAYIIMGQVILPTTLLLLDIERDALGMRGQALLHLSIDVSQVCVCVCV